MCVKLVSPGCNVLCSNKVYCQLIGIYVQPCLSLLLFLVSMAKHSGVTQIYIYVISYSDLTSSLQKNLFFCKMVMQYISFNLTKYLYYGGTLIIGSENSLER